jgi:hypothetical protein
MRFPCKSSQSGDFSYRACAPFCASAKASSHCAWCKCADCPYCLGGAGVSAAAPKPPKSAAPKATAATPKTSKAATHQPAAPRTGAPPMAALPAPPPADGPGLLSRLATLFAVACLPTILLLAWWGLAPPHLSPMALRHKLLERSKPGAAAPPDAPPSGMTRVGSDLR